MAWQIPVKLVFLLICVPVVICTDGITRAECPLLCDCTGFDVTCNGTDVFPDGISKKVRKFHLIDSSVDYIPINAFKEFRDLEEIRISRTKVRTVRACSYAELGNMTSLIFDGVEIQIMEGNSFANLYNITKVEFLSSKINEIKSHSFHGVEAVQRVIFSSTEIEIIHPFAFYRLKDIGDIQFKNCTISRFLGDVVSFIDNIQTFVIENSIMKEWHCGTLSKLAEKGVSFSVSNVTFQCDCGLTWLFERFLNTSIFAEESNNRCQGTAKSLSAVSLADICSTPLSRDKTCQKLLPSSPHTCSRSFDMPFNPEDKVEYPSFFTKQPSAVASFTGNRISLIIVFLGFMFQV